MLDTKVGTEKDDAAMVAQTGGHAEGRERRGFTHEEQNSVCRRYIAH
jgi:hypothetical protein